MKKLAVAFAMLLAALALVACGGSDDSTDTGGGAATEAETTEAETTEDTTEAGGGGTSAVAIEANPEGQLAYTTDSATAEAGEVTIEFTNKSPVPHDVDIENAEGEVVAETEVISEGEDSATAELEPGEYKFFCSVSGHRQAGMEGTLTVE